MGTDKRKYIYRLQKYIFGFFTIYCFLKQNRTSFLILKAIKDSSKSDEKIEIEEEAMLGNRNLLYATVK